MIDTIQCESQFKIRAVSPTNDRGLVQINRPSHPDVSEAEAFDPEFAIQFMAKEFKAGHQRIWSCYRKIKGTY